jgi:hypothetical protein
MSPKSLVLFYHPIMIVNLTAESMENGPGKPINTHALFNPCMGLHN